MKHSVGLLLLAFVLAGCRPGDEPNDKVIVNVSVQRAVREDVPLVVIAPATVFGRSEAHISARITAVIQKLFVHIGDSVRAGQLLAILDRRDLAAQLADAQSSAQSAQAAFDRTRQATIPLQVTQARGDLAAKKAALNLARTVFQRRKKLLAEGAISARDLETSKAALAQAQADYDAARLNLDAVEKHTSAEDLQMAQDSLAQAKARESLASANLSFAEIRSPFTGSVTGQFVYPGDLASPGTQLFTVADLSVVEAKAQVEADEAVQVKVGQVCAFSMDSAGVSTYQGRIAVVNQAVDPARRTVEVWCEIPNHDGALKSGLFGSVTIQVGTARQAVTVPASAVEFQEGTQQGKVYVVDNRHVAHLRTVTAALVNDHEVRVMSGLRAGELVIATGEYGLPDNTEVNPAGTAQ